MKRSTVMTLLAATALAGCNKTAPENSGHVSADTAAGPGVNVTEAPGLALKYEYRFSLAANRIAPLQEAHAQACEALGIARCRITGLHFQAGNDANDIGGELDFDLDPTLARQFGKQGIDAVVKAGGKLSQADITSTNAGAAIADASTDATHLRGNLAGIEAQLAKLPPNAPDRETLQQQAQLLRDQLDRNADSRREQVASLATTPVSFTYRSAQGWLGIDTGGPFHDAIELGISSMSFAITAMIAIIGAALPWLLLLIVARLVYLHFLRRLLGLDSRGDAGA